MHGIRAGKTTVLWGFTLPLFLLLFLSVPAFAQTVTDLTLGAPVTGSLSGQGDVRYYRVTTTTPDPLMVMLRGDDYASRYGVQVNRGSLTGPQVGTRREDYVDASVEVLTLAVDTYYITITNQEAGDRTFTLTADVRPTQTLTFGTQLAGQQLWGAGDVRYYKATVTTACTSLIALMRGSNGAGEYDLVIHSGSLTGTALGTRREYYLDASVEAMSPTYPRNYYLEVRNRYWDARSFTVAAFRKTIQALPMGGTAPQQRLWGCGDVFYFKTTATACTAVLAMLRGEYSSGYYDICVRPGSLTADPVGNRYDYYVDSTVDVRAPAPGDYYIEIRALYEDPRGFTLKVDQRQVVPLPLGQDISKQTLWAGSDVRFYRLSIASSDPLLVFLRSTYYCWEYDVRIHEGSLTGTEVGSHRLYTRDRAAEITIPVPGDYYVEVRAVSWGSHNFLLRAEQRPVTTITPGGLATNEVGTFWGGGDIRYYRFTVADSTPVMVCAHWSSTSYISVLRGAINGPEEGTRWYSGTEGSVALTEPTPGDYYVAIGDASDGAHAYSLEVIRRELAVTPLTLGERVTDQALVCLGDVRYYRVTVTEAAPLLALIWGTEESGAYEVILRKDSLTGTPVGVRRENGSEISVEEQAATAGDYYISVRKLTGGSRAFALQADLRPVETLSLDEWRVNVPLWAVGDVRYYEVSVPACASFLTRFWGNSWNQEDFDLIVHRSTLDAPTIGTRYEQGGQPESLVDVMTPTPGAYLIEVRSRYWGMRTFTLSPVVENVRMLTPGVPEVDVPLWLIGDVRYYKVRVAQPGTDALKVWFTGTADIGYYNISLRLGSPFGADVGTWYQDWYNAGYFLLNAPLIGDYYVVVRSGTAGTWLFTLQADTPLYAQPDGHIRSATDTEFLGNDIYSVPPLQTAAQAPPLGIAAVYLINAQNDGNTPDALVVTGTAGNAPWRVRYFSEPVGGSDITAEVTGGGWNTLTLGVGEMRAIRLEVTALTAPLNDTYTVQVTATSTNNSGASDAVFALTAAGSRSVGYTYTSDADFDLGEMAGVEHETVHNQLQLTQQSVTLPFIWVPNSNEGTISKVDTRDGRELGRYRVCPSEVVGNPSRTTVDLEGSCYVGNRNSGTVVKVGLLENEQWSDRNGNGVCDTSRDLNGDSNITGDELLPWGQDECVLFEVFLWPGEEATYVPGEYTGWYPNDYWSPGPRGLAVDNQNNVWIGTYGTQKFYYVNGATGAILRNLDTGHSSYGATIDANGIVWSSGQGASEVGRLDPATDTLTTISLPYNPYGIAPDHLGHVFLSSLDCKLMRIDVNTGTIDWAKDADFSGGIAVTDDNNVWESTQSDWISRWDNDGNLLARIPTWGAPWGVSVDAAGKVWSVDVGSEYIHRFDPHTNTMELSKRIIGTSHYGYSDMTGIVSRQTTTRLGTWTVVHNARMQNAPWGILSWNSSAPAGTAIIVKVCSSNNRRDWSAWETATSGTPLTATPPGQYLKVQVTLQRLSGDVSPVLYDLTVAPLKTVSLTAYPPSPSAVGMPITLTATPTWNANIEHQFFYHNGMFWVSITGGYTTSSTCTWTPTVARTYSLKVWSREVGSGVAFQAYASTGFVVRPALSAVSLAANPASPSAVGMPITLTATPTGGGTVEYRYFVNSGSGYVALHEGYIGASCPWTPAAAGTFALKVWARERGSTAAFDKYAYLTGFVVRPALSGVSLSASPASPSAVGILITLTATPTGGGTVEYRFFVSSGGGYVAITPGYSTSATCTWTATTPRTYSFKVWARERGSTAVFDKYAYLTGFVVRSALSGVILSASPASPSALGIPITLTATRTGGGTVEYRFFYLEGATWVSIGGGYSTSNTRQWTPTVARTYQLKVWARERGSTAGFDKYASSTHTVTP